MRKDGISDDSILGECYNTSIKDTVVHSGWRRESMKKWEVICGLVFPWILIFLGIPGGTYYITNLPVRGIYIGVIVFSAGILFRLALDIWQDKRKK